MKLYCLGMLQLFLAFGLFAQNNLAYKEIEVSDLKEFDLSQHASIDFRNFEDRNLAIAGDHRWLDDGNGPLTTKMEIKMVSDHRKLDQELDQTSTLKATAKYMTYDGSASYSSTFENDLHTDEKTISIIIKMEADYGFYGYRTPQLIPTYNMLLAEGKHEEFIRECGTHFVSKSKRVVQAIAIINIKNLDETTKKFLSKSYEAKIKGSYSGFEASAEGKSSLQELINTGKNIANVDVSFRSIGGGGAPALQQLVQNIHKTNIEELLSALAAFFETGTKDNAAVSRYILSSYHRYGMRISQMVNYDELYLNSVYNGLFKINSDLARLEESFADKLEYLDYFEKMKKTRKESALIYEALVRSCLYDSNCSLELPELEKIYWPNDWIRTPVLFATPNYIQTNKKQNGIPGRILYNVTVRLEGYLLFPEYYNRFEFGYFDKNGTPHTIKNFVAGDRIMFELPEAFGEIRAMRFLAQVDSKTGKMVSNSAGLAIDNVENIQKATTVIKEIGEREYYLRSYSNYGKEFTTYLGRVDTRTISNIIR